MSVPNRLMSYDSLKSVLRHMDPNQRALLASRCPLIKTTDSILPQKIDSIHLEPYSITINDTTYRMGVIQQYPQGAAVPENVAKRNKEGGVQYDMDKFGFRSDSSDLTPGDLNFPAEEPKTEEQVRRLEQYQLKLLTQRMEKKLKMRKVPKFKERPYLLEEMDESIAELKAQILPYQLRQDNNEKDIPFTHYLLLIVSKNGPDGQKIQTTEILEYNRSLGTAMKYLVSRLLKKPMMISVDILKFSTERPPDESRCFRLPADHKFTAHHVKIDINCENLLKIIRLYFDINNFPRFRSMELRPPVQNVIRLFEDDELPPPTLVIDRPYCYGQYDRFRHKNIRFNIVCFTLEELLKHWEANGAETGVHYTARTDKERGSEWYQFMKRQENTRDYEHEDLGCELFPEIVILQMTEDVQLEFYINELSKEHNSYEAHLEIEESL